MNREALGHAIATVAKMAGLSAAFAITLTAAIWLPTLALQHLAGLAFVDAYLLGCPIGISIITFMGLGVMTYRQNARRAAALQDLANIDRDLL